MTTIYPDVIVAAVSQALGETIASVPTEDVQGFLDALGRQQLVLADRSNKMIWEGSE